MAKKKKKREGQEVNGERKHIERRKEKRNLTKREQENQVIRKSKKRKVERDMVEIKACINRSTFLSP